MLNKLLGQEEKQQHKTLFRGATQCALLLYLQAWSWHVPMSTGLRKHHLLRASPRALLSATARIEVVGDGKGHI